MADSSSRFSAKRITKSFFFRRLLVRASGIVGKPFLLYEVAKKSLDKADKDSSLKGMATEGIASVFRLVRLVKAYAKGDYRDVSTKNVILTVASLLYFVSPLDLIPDAIPFIGFLDDITIIGYVLSMLGEELTKFEAFENDRKRSFNEETHEDLVRRAKAQNIENSGDMSRDELADALSKSAARA